jgi:hypothetical protein
MEALNVLLWIVQVALALQFLAGGGFKVFKLDSIAQMPTTRALPHAVWRALGVFEMSCAVLLIVPAAVGWMPILTVVGAAALGLENLALAALYARFSLRWSASNPLVYALAGAVQAAFVAAGRYWLSPPG